MSQPLAATLADLRQSGHVLEPVKAEMRRNLVQRLRAHEPVLSGFVGYDDTVLPQVYNAVLSGHDLILLGERGQGKSRLMRSLVTLLDEVTPVIAGCEINDHPYRPTCRRCLDLVAAEGEATPVVWLERERRYAEKLATPDISIADLIGEVDPVKVAEGRHLSDELTIHYGLVPRANRGIFGINELPDLAERIQVGLLNVMQEKDVQIRGYLVRMPLDIMVVASANPEDYTSRGRIITPLKDRFGSQVRTHYPRTTGEEIGVMEQEAARPPDDPEVLVPAFMKEVVAEITQLARRSPRISQTSGVSVRMSIGNLETLVSNSVRRALRLGESLAVPRVSDLQFLTASTGGRIEIETLEEGREEQVIQRLHNTALSSVFSRHFSPEEFRSLLETVGQGESIEVGEGLPAAHYAGNPALAPDVERARRKLKLTDRPEVAASVAEFVLEGLHLAKRLNKTEAEGGAIYRG